MGFPEGHKEMNQIHVAHIQILHCFLAGIPWIGKCTSYDPKSDEFDIKWYRGSYEGPWYPDRRYHPTKLHFSSVMSWGFELTANKTLKENNIQMLKDLLKEHKY